jgi:hypothetical protein
MTYARISQRRPYAKYASKLEDNFSQIRELNLQNLIGIANDNTIATKAHYAATESGHTNVIFREIIRTNFFKYGIPFPRLTLLQIYCFQDYTADVRQPLGPMKSR